MTAGIIHLTDADEERGCVRVVPGSHRQGPLPVFQEGHGGPQNLYLDPAKYPIADATPCRARRGDVLFFNYLTIHGSGINQSSHVRKTVLVQFRDPADLPLEDRHTHSLAQGMMLRGINPRGQWRTEAPKPQAASPG
jgi:ectoine hydroxylase-related dioxygenase (phytanoyl-CoA dioxygenase family)